MGDIIFNCAWCGKSLAIDSRGAWMCVKCTDCGRELIVPLVSDAAEVAPEIRERPKLRLKRDVQHPQSSSVRRPADCKPVRPRRSVVPKIVFRMYTSSILVAFSIAFLIAVVGNLAWQWMASHLGDVAEMLDDIGGLLILAAPIYAAIKMLRARGFLIGLLCAIMPVQLLKS